MLIQRTYKIFLGSLLFYLPEGAFPWATVIFWMASARFGFFESGGWLLEI